VLPTPTLHARPGAKRPGAPPPAPAPGKPAPAPEQKQVKKRGQGCGSVSGEGKGNSKQSENIIAGNVVSKERKQGTEKEKEERCFFFPSINQYFKTVRKKTLV